jgi:hypothetical protein
MPVLPDLPLGNPAALGARQAFAPLIEDNRRVTSPMPRTRGGRSRPRTPNWRGAREPPLKTKN